MTLLRPLRLTRCLLLVASSFLLIACQLFEPEPSVPSVPMPPVDRAPAQLYRLDSQRSVIQLKVYRDGMLARLGHNHVISATQISGLVHRRDPLGQSTFELSFPVAQLQIDRPADRRRAGADFPGELPKAQIDGTRSNMLGPQVLAAENFPAVTLRSIGMEGKLPTPVWRVAVQVRDHVSELRVPVYFQRNGAELTVQGAVKLSQRELGLQPFCVLGGKLCVRDDIDAEFYLVAVPVS